MFLEILEQEGISSSGEEVMNRMKKSLTYTLSKYIEEHGLSQDAVKRYVQSIKDIDHTLIPPIDGAMKVCKATFKNGGENYVFTNRDESVYEFMEYHGFKGYITDYITKNDVIHTKPEPDGILKLIERHNMNKDEVLMVGDRDIDVLSAKNAGIKSCLFNNGGKQNPALSDYTIDSLEELLEILKI